MLVDPSVIKRVKQGNEAAFKIVYDAFSQKIFTVAVKFGLTKDEAEEIVQEVFVKLWNHRQTLNENLSINAYLLTITKNTLITRQKKLTYEIAYKKYLEKRDLNSFTNIEDEIIYSDFEKLAQSFIDRLPSQQKDIFLLSKKENLSNKEIADKLNISLRTVENQVYRATKKIKEELKRNSVIISLVIAVLFII